MLQLLKLGARCAPELQPQRLGPAAFKVLAGPAAPGPFAPGCASRYQLLEPRCPLSGFLVDCPWLASSGTAAASAQRGARGAGEDEGPCCRGRRGRRGCRC